LHSSFFTSRRGFVRSLCATLPVFSFDQLAAATTLGIQFITSNPNAGLDWPVRLLLTQDDNGDVWAVWTDFEWIAKRHNIQDRVAQFKMATMVVGSIISTITAK